MNYSHLPVLLTESIDYLNVRPGRTYVDCTLGGGGHSAEIIARRGKVIGFDQDAEALAATQKRLGKSIVCVHDNFRSLKKHLAKPVDGFLFDLGVSSPQIDQPERGFTIRENGPLDMRMDQRQQLTAADIVNDYPETELAKIFFEFGEERFSRRVARAIVQARTAQSIKTTGELKELVEKAIPVWKKRESVTRIFQALRIAVNDELKNLQDALNNAISLLKPKGRLVVISYHSLEDRIVKRTLREAEKLTVLTKKPVTASEAEIASNPRAKSAKLRAAEAV